MHILALSITMAAIPSLILLFYFRHLDSQKPEPMTPVFKLFFMGILAVIPAALLELLIQQWGVNLSGILGNLFKAFIIAGLVEESMKLAVVRISIYKNPVFDEVADGIVYTIAASLGFAFFENIIYSLGFGIDVILIRSVTAVPLHAIASGIMGYYIGLSKFTYKNHMLKGLVIAILIHGFYNFCLFTGGFLAFLVIPLLIIFFYVLKGYYNRALELDREEGRS